MARFAAISRINVCRRFGRAECARAGMATRACTRTKNLRVVNLQHRLEGQR